MLGGGLALGVFGLWYWWAASLDLPEPRGHSNETTDELHPLFVVIPTLVGILCGSLLGFAAGIFESARYLKLLGSAMGLYFFAAWLSGGALVIATMIQEGQTDPDGGGVFVDSLQAGLMGAIILSPVCIPLILVLVAVLERITRDHTRSAS